MAALAGEREKAESVLAECDATAPAGAYFLAVTYGALGDLDKGFPELERARDLRFGVMATVKVNPSFDPYRSDPRWVPFVESLHLGV